MSRSPSFRTRYFQYDYTVFRNGRWSELTTVYALNLKDAEGQVTRKYKVGADDIEWRGSDNPADGELYVGNDN